MTTYPKIWFLRHGQTIWNREHRLQGQLDSPLTTQGLAEARRQAALMPPILALKPALFASPLGRARQTADIALGGAAYQADPRLMEIHAGDWQGLLRHEIMTRHPTWAARQPTPLDIYEAAEGGEGLTAFHTRIRAFLRDLEQPSVIVAHGLLGQVLRAEVRGLPLASAGGLSNLQGCIYVIENGEETLLGAAQ